MFSALLWINVFQEAFLGTCPGHFLHAPEEKRTFSQDDLWNSASMFRLNDLIRWIIKDFQPVGLDPAQNLKQLGGYLTEWGKLSFSDFEYQLNTLICQKYEQTNSFLRKPYFNSHRCSKILGGMCAEIYSMFRIRYDGFTDSHGSIPMVGRLRRQSN